MNCDQIKFLLLTDYFDNELDKETFLKIEKHLANCPVCLAYNKSIQKEAKKPFLEVIEDVKPPKHLWENIKKEILNKQQRENNKNSFKDAVVYYFRRPALVFSSAALIVFFIGAMIIFSINGRIKNDSEHYLYDQIDFLSSLEEGNLIDQDVYSYNSSFDDLFYK